MTNVLAENDVITQEGFASDLSYTLVTQREPDKKVCMRLFLIPRSLLSTNINCITLKIVTETHLQGLPRATRFLELVLSYLPDWRKATAQFPVIPWQQFMDHVREQVNPLSADDHLKEVIQQLQLMGEVTMPTHLSSVTGI